MRFPIDVVFVDKELHVLKVVERLAPWRAASARRARAALELASGEIVRRGVSVGDALEIVDARVGLEPRGEDSPALRGATRAQDGGPSNRAAPLTRVLLITSDRRFRVLAAALLTQRGCSLTLAERMTGVAARATREASHVVVLDATMSVTAAAREAADVDALEPRVGVVMVAEETADRTAATLLLPKWDPFDRLYGAIEAARDRVGPRCC